MRILPLLYKSILFIACISQATLVAQNTYHENLAQWSAKDEVDSVRAEAGIEVLQPRIDEGKYDSALLVGNALLQFTIEHDQKFIRAKTLNNFAIIYLRNGQLNKADSILVQNITFCDSFELERPLCDAYSYLGRVKRLVGQFEEGIDALEKSITYSACKNDSVVLGYTYETIGATYYSKGDYGKSIASFEMAKDLYLGQDDVQSIAQIYNNIGRVSFEVGNYQIALENYYEALDVLRNGDMSETFVSAAVYNNLGNIYQRLQNYPDAIKSAKDGLRIAEILGYPRMIANSHANLGKSYLHVDSLELAAYHIRQCLTIRSESDLITGLPMAYILLGDLDSEKGDFESAIAHYKKSIAYAETNGQIKELAKAHHQAAVAFLAINQLSKAKQNIEASIAYAQQANTKAQIVDSYQTASEVYALLGNFEKAHEMLQNLLVSKDSIADDDLGRELLRKDLAFDYAQRAYRDSVENATVVRLQEAEIEKEKASTRILWVSIVVFIILIAVLFHRYRISQKQKKTIEEEREKLNEANEKLIGLDKMKSDFFANVSHEFRTPLTLILGPVNRLLKKTDLDKKEIKYLETINDNAEQLNARINQILDLSRLEADINQLEKAPVGFKPFLDRLLGNYASTFEEKELQLDLDVQLDAELQLNLDQEKYGNVVNNLLSNAIKYTPQKGQISVKAWEEDAELSLEVKDTGIGIPPEDLPRLFNRFYQAKNAQKNNSSGIGLAICQELAVLMNGKIEVESEIGKGSAFTFSIPFEAVGSETADERPVAIEATETRKQNTGAIDSILVIEDNESLREFIKDILSDDFNVTTAEHGQIALEMLNEATEHKKSLPNLIVSDVMMPVMDGLTFLEKIKASDKLRHLPVIMLTAKANSQSKFDALRMGVDDYMTKPFDDKALMARIHGLLQNQKDRFAFIQTEISGSEVPTEAAQEEAVLMSKADMQWLKQLEELVSEHLNDSEFTVVDYAEAMQVSERHFRRKLKKSTGLAFFEYIRTARLAKARTMLELGEKDTVAEVAYAVGFENPSYFSKVFAKEFGQKPNLVRELK
jgi:signal transduction histidine kinase/DNA-binding response OmpR family regulator